jgi:hypothetical protein
MNGVTPAELAREMVCVFLEACGNPEELAISLSIRQLVEHASELKEQVDRLLLIVQESALKDPSSVLTGEFGTDPSEL